MSGERNSEETILGVQDQQQHEEHTALGTKSEKVDQPGAQIEHSHHAPSLNPQIKHHDPLTSATSAKDGRIELKEIDAPQVLGFAFPTLKKWGILSVIFVVQCSMNFNASVYANGVGFLTEKFDISEQAARVGQMIFLVSYAFGCELWAPWSEELGRWPTLQLSLLFVNSGYYTRRRGMSGADRVVWQIPAALAPNFATVVVSRFLGGVSSAGGSVTLGMGWSSEKMYRWYWLTPSCRHVGCADSTIRSRFRRLFIRLWQCHRTPRRTVHSSSPLMAMDLLDPTHVWRLRSSLALFLRPRNSICYPTRSRSKATTKRRSDEHLRTF